MGRVSGINLHVNNAWWFLKASFFLWLPFLGGHSCCWTVRIDHRFSPLYSKTTLAVFFYQLPLCNPVCFCAENKAIGCSTTWKCIIYCDYCLLKASEMSFFPCLEKVHEEIKIFLTEKDMFIFNSWIARRRKSEL